MALGLVHVLKTGSDTNFTSQRVSLTGKAYVAQYLSQEAVDEILAQSEQRYGGRQRCRNR